MPLKADMKYDGTIQPGAYFSYSMNGNLGFQIPIMCDDGQAWFTLWLTEKNRDKATKTLIMLGADPDKLSSQSYLENFLPNAISGKEISFGTKEDTYNDKTTVKISWIGKRTDPDVSKGAASFFGGKKISAPAGPPPPESEFHVDESDVPF